MRGGRCAGLAATLAALLAGTDAATAGPPEADPPLARLLAGFAEMPGLEARFREEKHLSVLREPLVSEGTLYFAPPDQILRRQDQPFASVLLLRGSQLSFSGPAGSRSLDLEVQPGPRAFVESLRLILVGDLDGLQALHRISLRSADRDEWGLELVPRSEPLAAAIASLQLRGRGILVSEFRVRDRNGDETVIRFRDVDPTRRFGEREREALFRLPSP